VRVLFLLFVGGCQSRLVGARIGEHDLRFAALQSGCWALSVSDKAAESAESASPFADPDPRQASLLRLVDAPTEYESSNSFQR